MSSIKHFGAATFCFLFGVTSFYLCSKRPSESPKPILTGVSIDGGMQGSTPDIDSSRFYESKMLGLQDSVSRAMPSYQFGRAICTCPGIISDQQSYAFGLLTSSGNSLAELYIAEARSNIAAKKWIEDSCQAGADRFLRAANLEAVRSRNRNGRDLTILIRSDKFVVQISGEALAVETLAKGVLRELLSA
jgi:hypothetical protein